MITWYVAMSIGKHHWGWFTGQVNTVSRRHFSWQLKREKCRERRIDVIGQGSVYFWRETASLFCHSNRKRIGCSFESWRSTWFFRRQRRDVKIPGDRKPLEWVNKLMKSSAGFVQTIDSYVYEQSEFNWLKSSRFIRNSHLKIVMKFTNITIGRWKAHSSFDPRQEFPVSGI